MIGVLRRLRLHCASLAFLLAFVAGGSETSAQDRGERWSLPPELHFPNGLASSGDGSVYVGGVTSGRIWRRDPRGEWSVFYPGSSVVFAVTSLRLDEARGVLWGASPDAAALLGVAAGLRPARPHRVFALDVASGRLLTEAVVPEGGFGNDLALDGEGGVFVTDSLRGRVWRLAADGRTWSMAAAHPTLAAVGIGAAGLARLPSGDLVVGVFSRGELVRVRRPGPYARFEVLRLARGLLRPDGMGALADGRVVLVTGGTGEALLLDPDAGTFETLAKGLKGPVNVDVRDYVALVTESGITDPAAFDPQRPPVGAAAVRRLVVPPRGF